MTIDVIGNIWDIVNSFTKKPRYVTIYEDKVSELAEKIKKNTDPTRKHEPWGPPKIPLQIFADHGEGRDIRDRLVVMYELMAASINYQYWYGRHNIRPNDSSAVRMYQILDEAWNRDSRDISIDGVMRDFKRKLVENRFPAVDKRLKHLDELTEYSDLYGTGKMAFVAQDLVSAQKHECFDANIGLLQLMTNFPGFAEDMFLKRAFLFFIMLYMKMGWFEKEIDKIPVPADYQVPKMLRWFDCLYYDPELQRMIDDSVLIPENSLIECEIRASTMLVCKKLAEQSGCKTAQVDAFLWGNRKSCNDPFHLTITTNY